MRDTQLRVRVEQPVRDMYELAAKREGKPSVSAWIRTALWDRMAETMQGRGEQKDQDD